jgi:RNA polymerase sigma factor (TIGR02999 family)
MAQATNDLTRLLDALQQEEPQAADQLLPLVYEELRRLARQKLPSGDQTLQPTALVHEAYLRLVSSDQQKSWAGRRHFFAAAAEAMRHILVDQARRKQRLKHGAGWERLTADTVNLAAPGPDERVLLVHDVLDELAAENSRQSTVAKLRYFAGLSHAEVADVLGISEKTARRQWNLARIRLYQLIELRH